MSAFIDLTGKRFGRLVVLSLHKKLPNLYTKTTWNCECDCGNTKIIAGQSLRSGHSKSCGCLKGKPVKDLVGKRFGKLLVISFHSKHKQFRKWNCKCDCGNVVIRFGHCLGRNKTSSCGCQQESMDNIIGKKFNHFWVLRFSHSTYSGRYYRCRCDCGNIVVKLGSKIRSGSCKSCGCLKRPYEDLTGRKFKHWTVLRLSTKQKQRRTWRCKCTCGTEKDVMEFSLRNGDSKSCGCAAGYESFLAVELKKYFVRYYEGIPEYRICKNPKTNYILRCDIYLPKHKTYIEVHGEQHYRPTNSFHKRNDNSFLYRKSLDDLKKSYAENNGTYIEIDLRKIKKVKDAIMYIEERL